VVTGSLIQGNTNLVSPVTVLDQTTLDSRGISSIQTALQSTLMNNGPAVNNNWSGTDENFAQGASAISLRGLTTNSTLVLFDGMRAAYYPIADDGVRNFVDLNTIPDDIVENIQILRDGASSAYGADAIAGVVNIITKKEFQGLSARAEGGISDRGDAAEWKFSVTGGVGDLAKDKVNFYISASYAHSDVLYARERPYPFDSYNWTQVCDASCGANKILNGISAAGTFAGVSTSANFMVRPYNFNSTTNQITSAVTGSRWQSLDGCANGTLISLTTTQQGTAAPPQVCQYDYWKLGGGIMPSVTRAGLTGHSAFELPNGIEGYVEANFMQDSVFEHFFLPSTLRGNAPAGINYPAFSTSVNYTGAAPPAPGSFLLYLPVYVCSERVNCATAADKQLNPNNPFAAAGQPAGIIGRDWYAPLPTTETRDRTYRVAGGLSGTFYDDWRFDVGVTAMHIDLHETQTGYAYIQHLIDVVNDGTFNFVDPTKNNTFIPSLNMTANQYLFPVNTQNMSSDEAQVKASITAPLYKLPGGDLTVVVGGSITYEAIDDPSGNSDANGPTQRYFVLNAFGTKGSRDVYAAYFEINAPVLEELVINGSGRYDAYSEGPAYFSPKIGVWSKPLDWLTMKGAYSQGFRIPSFAEANSLPTTGYVTNNVSLFNNTYLAQYGCTTATFATCPTYVNAGSYGLTTIANPKLKPEKSRSWTFDVTVQPIDEVTLNATYYNIKKTGAIAQLDCSAALQSYYTSGVTKVGDCTIIPDAPDPNFPTAQPIVRFLYAPFVNANAVRTSGFDFSVSYESDLTAVEDYLGLTKDLGPVHLTSEAQATFIQNLDTKFADGHIERYDGTLGNFNLTSGSGTPKWKGTWQNTFTAGAYEFTSTLNWISGYNLSAMDQGTGYRDCGLDDGSVPCRTADYFTWDVNMQAHVNDNVTMYFTVLNVLDALPPVDTIATYGITGYNEVVGGDGILGRYLKAGIKLDY